MFPIAKLITSFLHDCVTYKDVMDFIRRRGTVFVIKGERGIGVCVGISCILDSSVVPHYRKGGLQM